MAHDPPEGMRADFDRGGYIPADEATPARMLEPGVRGIQLTDEQWRQVTPRSELRRQWSKDSLEALNTAMAERDRWIRLFNRLDAAITHHHNEALYKARERVLRDAAKDT